MTLIECWAGSDKLVHGYLPLYERHLNPFAIETLTEVGVEDGESLVMWRRWLPPSARVVGVDIDPACLAAADDGIEVLIGDAATMDPPHRSDVFIDDGSHHGDEQMATFVRWWPSLEPGGWYVIEDLATAFGPVAGKVFRPGAKALMGGLLVAALQGDVAPLTGRWWEGLGIAELHAYEEIIFARKG